MLKLYKYSTTIFYFILFIIIIIIIFYFIYLLFFFFTASLFFNATEDEKSSASRTQRGIGEESQINNISVPSPYSVISPVLRYRPVLLSRFSPRVQPSTKNTITCVVGVSIKAREGNKTAKIVRKKRSSWKGSGVSFLFYPFFFSFPFFDFFSAPPLPFSNLRRAPSIAR